MSTMATKIRIKRFFKTISKGLKSLAADKGHLNIRNPGGKKI